MTNTFLLMVFSTGYSGPQTIHMFVPGLENKRNEKHANTCRFTIYFELNSNIVD